ncbi:helix-turn-helix domain-containing protein [Streptomyces sp. DSM 44917]|uniref:Helix-turn-helix domain-containing protein n=1 Tax=Streptomyces boetiae TaxID=3075541 RepID=A0ABU2L7H2_9ACTN|nr:helix-turn-helix domain-containing protein [Streptomyces sp. DSM 44917]MDT0307520.1 helix-turn-helix domain-containing protein [Streptomyces sp. DSM 44917]
MDHPASRSETISVVSALLRRAPELGDRLARNLRAELESYRDEDRVPADSLRESCRRNLELPLRHLLTPDRPPDLAPARKTGRDRALQGIPLPEVLYAFRTGFELLWSELVVEARRTEGVSSETLVPLAAEVWRLVGEYSDTMAMAYRETAAELTLRRERERSVLVEALFTGVITDRVTQWEAARTLGLSATGPYLVAAADVPAPGQEALPGVEAALLAGQVPSAWRLLPDQQIGVLSVRSADAEATALDILREHGTRLGVSPRYDALSDTPRALRLARLALAGLPAGKPGLAQFSDSPVAMLAAAAPEEARRLAGAVLEGVLGLPRRERDRLLETLEVWYAAGGSADEVGRRLFCHPNTVRYRLRAVEELTGRSLKDPGAVTDLGVALRALRLVPADAA